MALQATQDHKDSTVLADPNLKDLAESLGQIPHCVRDDNAFWGAGRVTGYSDMTRFYRRVPPGRGLFFGEGSGSPGFTRG